MKIINVLSIIGFSLFTQKDISPSEYNNLIVHTNSTETCLYNGKRLYGKIQVVEYAHQADVKVKIVNSFPDLKVKYVQSFPDDCGEWQIVDFCPDLKVYFTDSFPDIKIKLVTSFPGIP